MKLGEHVLAYLQAFIIIFCFVLLLFGFLGIHRATYGLEMSDVLPEHTAPAAFLRARDRYFSFYPMFAVLKGPDLDYSRNQHKIDNYRTSIGISFVSLVLFTQENSC